ncbi:hypothetical protein [Pseudomonas umsongensis]|uniref:hypothetical protein n=1 Tax=Pseudomonas umsongensis TaxID=198618 RepID=UPI0015C0E77C|nr:hypothetical protein [Pseudomonas umsongensis]NWL23410.1 hypothetical protein [Pseudomonas umsongensis]
MASTETKTGREQANAAYLKKRSDYRAIRVEKPIELDAADFVDTGKTILHGPRLIANQKLSVGIPRWTITPPPGVVDTVTLMLDIGDGRGFDDVDHHDFTIPAGETDYLEVFPFVMEIPLRLLPRDAACRLQYRIFYFNRETDYSTIASFHCDQIKPYNGEPPAALTLANPLLDDTSLPVGSKLSVTIPPGYAGTGPNYDWKAGDIIAIYLVDAAHIPDDPSGLTPLHVGPIADPATAGTVVELDGDTIRTLGDTEGVFIYVLRDAALNDSAVSIWTKVSLTFGELPSAFLPPTVPQADPGPLLLEHARDGVSVWFKRYRGYKPEDSLVLTWGSTVARQSFPIPDNGAEDIEIPVTPARVMLLEYGQATVGAKSTAVSYEVFRKGRPFGPQSTTIDVNFKVAIPLLPWPPAIDWPVPVQPDLLEGTVKNHTGTKTNLLERDDKNQKATFTFKWHNDAINGHVINFEWNGKRVDAARLVFDDTPSPGPGHVPGEDVTVEIPWENIKAGGNGNTIPVQYWLSHPPTIINELPSVITWVDVNAIAVELPEASFPKVPGHYPGCSALEANGDLLVAIPDLSDVLEAGDSIRVVFTPMTGEFLTDPDAPISAAIHTKNFTLGSADAPLTGFQFPVTPYGTHIKPLYDLTAATNRRGRMKIQYFFNDGTEDIESTELVIITAFHRGADECPITPPR